jgi:lysyl-tRNA synthetase class 2
MHTHVVSLAHAARVFARFILCRHRCYRALHEATTVMINEFIAARVQKLQRLRAAGAEHFPYSFERSHSHAGFLEAFDALEQSAARVTLAGRVLFRNRMGRLVFVRADDDGVRLQWVLETRKLGESAFEEFNATVDIGDICGVEGTPFRTKRGERSVLVDRFVVLAKCIRPLPEKYHGLRDKEMRYRQREVDLIMNPASYRVFDLRSRFVSLLRNWMEARGFREVEVPLVQLVQDLRERHRFRGLLEHLARVVSQAPHRCRHAEGVHAVQELS